MAHYQQIKGSTLEISGKDPLEGNNRAENAQSIFLFLLTYYYVLLYSVFKIFSWQKDEDMQVES